jgi:TolB-like protein
MGLRHGPAELRHDGLPVDCISGLVLNVGSELGLPTGIAVVGRYLLVFDLASDYVLHVLDATTGAYLTQLGRRGSGPGEFESAWSLDPVPGDSSMIWVYDIQLRRLTLVDVEQSVSTNRLAYTRMITLSSNAVPTGPVWLGDSTMVSLGFFPNGRIGFFDADGTHTASVGVLPGEGETDNPAILQHAYRATLVRNPSGTLLAAATRHASLVQIFGSDGTLIVDAEGPLQVRPQYHSGVSARGLAMQTGADLRFGYVDAASAVDHIYALFSGRTREGFPKSAYQGRFVHVFDWQGNFVRALQADADLISVALDRDGRVLYAVRHEPTPAILRYNLGTHSNEDACAR